MDSDFNRPMTHQPEVLKMKSKEDIWKDELGLNDADEASSTSSEDEENHPPPAPLTRSSNTATWDAQKAEMMLRMKEEQKELLRQKREMKEFEHQQQTKLKIAKKVFKETIAEKEMLIKELQDHIKDKDELIDSLKNSKDASSRSPATKAQSSLKKIINNISRLQDEKSKLSTKYENALDEIERLKGDAKLKEETDAKISLLSSPRRVTRSQSLMEEVTKLKRRVAELEQLQQQTQETSVQTDMEKELEKKVSALSSELTTVKTERDTISMKLEESKSTQQHLKEKVENLQKQLTDRDTSLHESTQELKSQLELKSLKIKELTALTEELNTSKNGLLNVEETSRKKLKSLEVEVTAKEEKVKKLESKLTLIEEERSNLSTTVSSLTASIATVTSEMNTKLSSLQDQGQASMIVYETESSTLRSNNATLTADLNSAKKDCATTKEQLKQSKNENETLRTNLLSVKIEKEQLQVQIKELQGECVTLKGVDTKNTSLQSHVVSLQKELETCRAQISEAQEKNDHLEKKLAKTERGCRDALAQKEMEFVRSCKTNQEMLEQAQQQAKTEAMAAVRRLSTTQTSLSSSQRSIICLRRDVTGVVTSLSEMNRWLQQELSSTRRKVTRAISDVATSNKQLVQKYHREMALRKKLHNQVIELKGNIRVLCRVRPPITEDGNGLNSRIVVTPDKEDDALVKVLWKGHTKSLEVDKVFGDSSTQEQMFEEVQGLVTSCMDGYNVCIFAYGQTGSGKTYTMEGPNSNPGINKRAVNELFRIASGKRGDWDYTFMVSMTEIYNEQVHDLLGSNPEARLDIKQGAQGNYVQGLTWLQVENTERMNQVFAMGHKNRATAATTMNIESSRSHALLCIKITGSNLTTGSKTLGKLNLIDLAGSERVSKSQAQGDRLKEAQSINKSLSALGDVIHSLRSKGPHVPYRNSKLTYLLQDSLSGDSKTLMVVQVAPVEKNVGETMCSLMFAERVKAVELGKAAAKKETAEIAALKEKLKEYEITIKGYKV